MNETPRYILDRSVATKWHLKDENHVDIALRVMNDSIHGRIRLFGPLHLRKSNPSCDLLPAEKTNRSTVRSCVLA